MEITRQQEQQIRQAIEDFSRAMKIRNHMNVRVAKRVTAILRIGMISFGVVTLILLLMLHAFTSKMDEMISALNTMNTQFTAMADDMTVMKSTLQQMNDNIAYVPQITQTTLVMQDSVSAMQAEVADMGGIIASLNQDLLAINRDVNSIAWQLDNLDPAVQRMGYDVHRMAGPMRMFNKFNPMD